MGVFHIFLNCANGKELRQTSEIHVNLIFQQDLIQLTCAESQLDFVWF